MTVYNKASLVLAESPAYKAGKIQPYYPLTPDVSFDFTRATSATRVNASGNIEKETQNLLLQSNQFDTTWTTLSASVAGGQTGYDGSSDAWLLESDSDGASRRVRQTTTASGISTFSVYAKAGSVDHIVLYAFGANSGRFFDLNPSTTGSRIGSTLVATPIDSKIEDVGGGWFRCSIVVNWNASDAWIYPIAVDGSTITTAGDNIYIQDAQLEQGLVARNYQETTTSAFYGGITDNVPRLDYTDGSCPSVLLEPQRTNLMIHSEYINSPHYGKSAGITLTNNYSDSPEGVKNSTRVQSADGNQYLLESFTLDANKTYVFTCYVKGTSGERVRQYVDGNGLPTGFVYEDILLDGTWQRNDLIINTDSDGGSVNPHLLFGYGVANPARDIETWGWQFEEGSYATSYIPTYGTSVTRSTDNMTGSPLSIYGLFGATEGSIFLEFTNPLPSQLANNSFYFTGLGGASSGYQRIRGYWQFYFPGLTFSPTGNLGNVKGHSKILAKWGNGSIKLFTDGVEEAASTYTGGDINMNGRLENIVGSYDFAAGDSRIKTMLFFSEAPTDDECIALTTL